MGKTLTNNANKYMIQTWVMQMCIKKVKANACQIVI